MSCRTCVTGQQELKCSTSKQTNKQTNRETKKEQEGACIAQRHLQMDSRTEWFEIQIEMKMNSKLTARGAIAREDELCTNLQIDFNRKAQREVDRN